MNEQFDVAILGAGFEGGMLGTILAYQGAKVVIIDAGTHPRFALGESTVRHTFRMIKIMAERFGVPEFKTEFNSGEQLHKHVSNHFGVKKNFGFVYHREGQHQKPEEAIATLDRFKIAYTPGAPMPGLRRERFHV